MPVTADLLQLAREALEDDKRATPGFSDSRLPERFWQGCAPDPSTGCWVWNRSTTTGYGRAFIGGREYVAHRLTYTTLVGPVADGMHLDHLCRNRACCNPAHLEQVTLHENMRRGLHGELTTHCPRGHEYTEENLYYFKNSRHRYCRLCNARAAAEYRLRTKAARQ